MQPPIEIRKSRIGDIPDILRIFSAARQYMRINNNHSQWSDHYPDKSDVLNDISQGVSYVGIDSEGDIVMTFAFIKGEDPTYKIIYEGNWLNEDEYGTIHRIASNGKIRGVLEAACNFGFQKVQNIRIDTHEDNIPMLRALHHLGFVRCGIIICRDGSPRIAFQKIKDKMENKFYILSELLKQDRSYRRFDENIKIDKDTLKKLVVLTRYCSSGRNLQPLKYFLACDEEKCEQIFPLLKWAGYLEDWDGPVKGERPTAYLIQCLDTNITKNYLCDDGLQLQAITLGATALGLGCCIIKSFNVVKLKEILRLEEHLSPLYVLAIGKPVEEVVIEDMKEVGEENIKYYRTLDKVHHVPKRSLEELLINK